MNKKMIASAMAIALATTANAAIVKTTPKAVKHKGVELSKIHINDHHSYL